MGSRSAIAIAVGVFMAAGCGHRPGTSASSGTSTAAPATTVAPATPAGTFEVLSFGPAAAPANATANATPALTFTFSKPVDPDWFLYGTTWLAAEKVDTKSTSGDYRTIS